MYKNSYCQVLYKYIPKTVAHPKAVTNINWFWGVPKYSSIASCNGNVDMKFSVNDAFLE